MPTYVYTCPDHKDVREEVVHKMSEDPVVSCPKCGKDMYRVPQRPAAIAFNPFDVLTSWMDENYGRWRTKSRRFSPDVVKRPGKPIPGKEVNFR